ncbi:uncharacterized protein [Panulirus ornatus]|uniref:uncharacterized protein n=1 Tax=Panulirus ornatus TaxID=150431 RepID=UPI003A8B2AF7
MILSQQHTLTEGMSEEGWEFLNQLSMQNKQGNGEETKNKRAGSPVSDIDESGENDITTYLNYIQDDDICLVGPVVTAESDDPITLEDPTPLETISEQDESDDEGDGVDGGMSALRLKSKLSAGMYNLNTIAEDGGEDFPQWDEEYAAEPGLPSIKEIPSDPAESDRSSETNRRLARVKRRKKPRKRKFGCVLKEDAS